MNIITRLKRKIYSRFLRYRFKYCHRSVWFEHLGLLVGPQYITIGANSDVQRLTYLTAWDGIKSNNRPEIVIGEDCHIGAFNHITCADRIYIGDGFVSGKFVTISDNGHGYTSLEHMALPASKRPIVTKGPVIINKNVWVGDKVSILSGVTIGEGSIVAANAVVTKDVPAYSVVAGNPAKVIKNLR